MTKNLFITGKPASGKTTLIKEVCLPVRDIIGGFYTEEIIQNGSRQGFTLKTFDDREGVLARKGMKSTFKLNKYGIDMRVLEDIGADALQKALKGKGLIIIDEIGSIENVSELFRKTVVECLSSEKRVLATVRYNAQPFTDEIRKMENTGIIVLSRENFIEVKREVKNWLNTAVNNE